MMDIKKRLMHFFSKGNEVRFDDDHQSVNQTVEKRNWIIVAVVISVCGVCYFTYAEYKKVHNPSIKKMKAQFASPVEQSDFDSDVTTSYLQSVQAELKTMKSQLSDQDRANNRLTDAEKEYHHEIGALKSMLNQLTDQLNNMKNVQEKEEQTTEKAPHIASPDAYPTPTMTGQQSQNGDALGFDTQPRYADDPQLASVAPPPFNTAQNGATPVTTGIESFQFASKRQPHTPDNYVPAGAFVTAVMTGGADANAGVNGTSDTAPVTFRAINDGFLPNGKSSHLKNCFFTASVFGEISSSRGVVRTDRMSCTLPNNEILDIPVQATAFNFGKNGIRGTAVMRNGKIIQMAGISGIFTGLGATAKGLS
ncbi:conjugal transfer protein TraB, partial [Photobacterium phosphoreum]